MSGSSIDEEVAIVILMGGESKRMGRDKAFVEWQGKTFLAHQLEKLAVFKKRIFLSVNAVQFDLLSSQFDCILDHFPNKGPLGGIYSSLNERKQPLIFVPVDMPNAHSIIEQLMHHNQATCFSFKQQLQPFPLLLTPDSIHALSHRIAHGELAIQSFLSSIPLIKLPSNESSFFMNVNSLNDE